MTISSLIIKFESNNQAHNNFFDAEMTENIR